MKKSMSYCLRATTLTGLLSFGYCAIGFAQNTSPWPATGDIGIGTATPTANLQILHNSGSACGTSPFAPPGGIWPALPVTPALILNDNNYDSPTSSYMGHNIMEVWQSSTTCPATTPSFNDLIFSIYTGGGGTGVVAINKPVAGATLDVGGSINADHGLKVGTTANVGTDLTVGNNANVTGVSNLTGTVNTGTDVNVGNQLYINNIPTGSGGENALMLICNSTSSIVYKQPMPTAVLSLVGSNLTLNYGGTPSTITLPTPTPPPSSWVGTATSPLNMAGFGINSAGNIAGTSLSAGAGSVTGGSFIGGSFSGSSISGTSINASTSVSSPLVSTTILDVTSTAGGGSAWCATFAGEIQVQSTTYTSDKRFKKNIENISSIRTELFRLNPYKYKFNVESSKKYKFDDKLHFGFLAQEVEELFPNLTAKIDDQGHLGVNYVEFIPLLLQAIKEQDVVIKEQEAKLNVFEKRIAALEQKMNTSNTTGVLDVSNNDRSTLDQNTPNPFGKETNIGFYVSQLRQSASIMISDMSGKELAKYAINQSGKGTINVKIGTMTPGMYLYTLIVDNVVIDSRKMIVNAD